MRNAAAAPAGPIFGGKKLGKNILGDKIWAKKNLWEKNWGEKLGVVIIPENVIVIG